MIHLEERHRKIVEDLLQNFPYQVFVYGSRSTGKCRKFSDLDLCILGRPKKLEIFYLQEVFEESDLPFTVDVVVWDEISKDFQALIKSDLQQIKGKT